MSPLGRYASAARVAVPLMSAVGCAYTSRQQGTGEFVDDSVITGKLKAAIFDEPVL